MKTKIYLLFILSLMFFVIANAQVPRGKFAKPFFAQTGIRKSISELKLTSQPQSLVKKPLDSNSIKPLRSVFKRYNNSARPVRGNRRGILPPSLDIASHNNASPLISSPAAINAGGSTQQVWSNFLSIDFYENPIG
jgi:hypothetical protein